MANKASAHPCVGLPKLAAAAGYCGWLLRRRRFEVCVWLGCCSRPVIYGVVSRAEHKGSRTSLQLPVEVVRGDEREERTQDMVSGSYEHDRTSILRTMAVPNSAMPTAPGPIFAIPLGLKTILQAIRRLHLLLTTGPACCQGHAGLHGRAQACNC